MVRSILADAKLPQKFLAEALSTAAYLRNRSPTKLLKEEHHLRRGRVVNQELTI